MYTKLVDISKHVHPNQFELLKALNEVDSENNQVFLLNNIHKLKFKKTFTIIKNYI